MKIRKFEKYINQLINEQYVKFEQKIGDVNSADIMTKIARLEKIMGRLEKKVVDTENTINIIWSLPVFREYRGKKL